MNSSGGVLHLGSGDLNTQLERWIEQRTAGRVHCLRVEMIEVGDAPPTRSRIIVRGCAGSYYVRQLALAAVLEVLEACSSDAPELVSLDIVVGSNATRPLEHTDTGHLRSRLSIAVTPHQSSTDHHS